MKSHPRRPHLLYIAFFYPPSRASGVHRALATSRVFLDAGWDVTVFTVDKDFLVDEVGSIDPTLVDLIPEPATLHRIPFSFWGTEHPDIRSLGWVQGNFPRFRRRHRGFPDKYADWIDPVTTAAMELADKHGLDHVLATGNPFASFEAARRTGLGAGVGYSIDFRDPWSFEVDTGRRVSSDSVIAAERRVIEAADACFHVNEAIAAAYAEAYPGQAAKQHVAENGFDAESIPSLRLPDRDRAPRFGVLGTVTERWPLQALLKGWFAARPRLPVGSELVIAGHLGYFDRSEQVLRSMLPAPTSGVTYVGPVAKRDVASFYSTIDIVVLPTPGGEMVTSGKAYEALALGVPIVCIQERGGGARRLLREHPRAYCADLDASSVANALLRAAASWRELTLLEMEQIRTSMQRHERHRALAPMIEVVESHL